MADHTSHSAQESTPAEMPGPQLSRCYHYIVNNYASFSLVEFCQEFEFGTKEAAEKAFKHCIGQCKRSDLDDICRWANEVQILDVEVHWRGLLFTYLEAQLVAIDIVAVGHSRLLARVRFQWSKEKCSLRRREAHLWGNYAEVRSVFGLFCKVIFKLRIT